MFPYNAKNQYNSVFGTVVLLCSIGFELEWAAMAASSNSYVPIYLSENLNINFTTNSSNNHSTTNGKDAVITPDSLGSLTSTVDTGSIPYPSDVDDVEQTANRSSNFKSYQSFDHHQQQQHHHHHHNHHQHHNGNTNNNNQHHRIHQSTYNVLELARHFEDRLKNIRNTELGVPFIQEIFDSMSFALYTRNDTKLVGHMAERLAGKLSRASRLIKETRRLILHVLQNVQSKTPMTGADATANAGGGGGTRKRVFLQTVIHPCRDEEIGGLDQHYDRKQIEILNYLRNVSDGRVIIQDDVNFMINAQLADTLKLMNYSVGNFKQVYFLSKDDFAINLKCNSYLDNLHLRRLLTSTIKSKHVLILIDHGGSLNTEQLELTKSFGIKLIQMLNEHDLISLVAISDKPIVFSLSGVERLHRNFTAQTASYTIKHPMYPATMDNKLKFIKFIDQLNRTKDVTNHTLGFQYAFRMLKHYVDAVDRSSSSSSSSSSISSLSSNSAKTTNTNGNPPSAVPISIIYVSRGLLSPLTEAKSVLEAISIGQRMLPHPVTINTCAIVVDEKRVMYEKQFLKDVAKQNYSKYNIDASDWMVKTTYNVTGSMFVINRKFPEEMVKASVAVFGHWFRRPYLEPRVVVHLPMVDAENDAVISMTQACEDVGLIGVNMHMTDIAEDVIYYEKYRDSYAFIIDMTGNTIMHPSYPRPADMHADQFPTPIDHLEQYADFANVLQRILTESKGNATIIADRNQKQITYTWQQAFHFYVVCLATIQTVNNKLPVNLNSRVASASIIHQYDRNDLVNIESSSSPMPELLYHRLDLIPPRQPTCMHFRQIATMESGTLFLSASSFKSPFVYLKNNRYGNEQACTDSAKSIMAYMKDTTNLLANPGLMPQVRNDATALHHIMAYLKKRHLSGGPLQKYIIRRYVATLNGVLQVFPGAQMSPDLEPMRRSWFIRAMENPGRIVITEPYLDAGGAGYIVSISHTIFENGGVNKNSPIAIVALDLTLGIIYKILQQSAGFCTESNMKCFLMEDKGYLVAHPSILEPITVNSKHTRRPLDHITHKESYVANDILQHKQLVQKKLCSNYFNRTNQRYYQFNTSADDVMTNIVHSERTKYQITIIPGTNVFVGVLNSTCDGGAFCPCSTVDRVCLNCNRMEQTYCECPCECPLNIINGDEYQDDDDDANIDSNNCDDSKNSFCNISSSTASRQSPQIEICESLAHDHATGDSGVSRTLNTLMVATDFDLKPCININCEIYLTHNDCLGIMGCEWCQVDVDGDSLFTSPFCTLQTSCFNGVLGSITPYGDGDLGASILDTLSPLPAYSAIGPVTGAIIVLCVVIGFAMYCYRQNLESGTEQLYVESMPENNFGGVPLSRLDYDDMGSHDDGDLGSYNAMNCGLFRPLNSTVAISEISPYRMNSGGYRRPNGESDHGYSTMTPHEDSEHMCFALAEPLINNKRLSLSDSTSINTSISSPTNNQNNLVHPTAALPLQQSQTVDKTQKKYHLNHLHHQDRTLLTIQPTLVPGMTTLPTSPHHIQAPVTVHHPMEASS